MQDSADLEDDQERLLSIDIGPVWIKLQLLGHCQALCSKCLVHLNTQRKLQGGSATIYMSPPTTAQTYFPAHHCTDLPPRPPLHRPTSPPTTAQTYLPTHHWSSTDLPPHPPLE